MSTLGQILANRENAQRSTGPKSDQGKAASSLNALQHGQRSAKIILAAEDQAEFAALEQALLPELAPATFEESRLARRIVALHWKQDRADLLETKLFDTAPPASPGAEPSPVDALTTRAKELALNLRYAAQHTRDLARARNELRTLQQSRHAAAHPPGTPALPFATQHPSALPGSTTPTPDATDWLDVVQELYYALAAGPQKPHPLPEHYYAAYAIWLKQSLMVEFDIGDDEAASQLAATSVALKMILSGAQPLPGTVWGSPEALADWRQNAARQNPYEKYCALVQRDYARRNGTVTAAALKLADLKPDADPHAVPGPWHKSGNLAQRDQAFKLAEMFREARERYELAQIHPAAKPAGDGDGSKPPASPV